MARKKTEPVAPPAGVDNSHRRDYHEDPMLAGRIGILEKAIADIAALRDEPDPWPAIERIIASVGYRPTDEERAALAANSGRGKGRAAKKAEADLAGLI